MSKAFEEISAGLNDAIAHAGGRKSAVIVHEFDRRIATSSQIPTHIHAECRLSTQQGRTQHDANDYSNAQCHQGDKSQVVITTSMTYIPPLLTIVETAVFQADARRIWSEQERGAFCAWLAANPGAY